MAYLRLPIILSSLLSAILLISIPAKCAVDQRDHLLQGLNAYRQSHNLPPLTKNDKAECLADEIADQIQDQTCNRPGGVQLQLSNYANLIKKCNIDPNTTMEGVVLPVCVPKRVETVVLTNYTQTQHARYLNNSKYTGVGIGLEDDWTVLLLTTSTPAGSFASATCFVQIVHWSLYLLSFLFVVFLVLEN